MAERLDFDTRVTREGRIFLPADARAALGIKPGDRVHLIVDQGEARLVTAQSLLHTVWANNQGGDGGNSVTDVRNARHADRARTAAKWERVEATRPAESRSEDAIETDLLDALGLTR